MVAYQVDIYINFTLFLLPFLSGFVGLQSNLVH